MCCCGLLFVCALLRAVFMCVFSLLSVSLFLVVVSSCCLLRVVVACLALFFVC